MNKIIKYTLAAGAAFVGFAALQSCSLDEPFGNQGEGTLRMRLEINSDVTRAELDQEALAANCVVYISNEKGLIRKYRGLENMPEQEVLRQGHYVAEAWTGDSVSASFDKKFYRCYQPFDVSAGVNQVQLVCKIANVVASVNSSTIDNSVIKDFHVTVENSKGALEFTEENYADAKGYFMMPYDEEGVRESTLKVTVSGKNIAGEPFTKERVINNVQSALEYVIGVSYTPGETDPEGGGYITITIDERENIISDTVAIFAAPSIEGVDFDIEKQIVGQPGQFSGDKVVKIQAFNEIRSFTLQCIDMANLNLPAQQIDLKTCTDEIKATLNSAGIEWDKTLQDVPGYDGIVRQLSYLRFTKEYLNNLPERDTEYIIRLTATDGSGKTTVQDLRIAVGDAAVKYDDPVMVEDAVNPNNLLALGAKSVELNVSLTDANAVNPGVRYREAGSTDWTTEPIQLTRASVKGTVRLKNLKPGTRYEYQAVAEGFESESKYFTTESVFTIPNASLEEWSDNTEKLADGKSSSALIPNANGVRSFWDTGNHGSNTMGVTLTQGSSDMLHSGFQSARLRSQFVGLGGSIGKFAAGNLFAGTYLETQGTDGHLEFGRPYDGSHPSKMRVYCHYRPGTVQSNGKGDFLAQGATDEAQIYVALTSAPVEIITKKANRKLFDPNGEEVLAYGQVTLTENFGPDGGLAELVIPIEYYAKARTVKPTHLVIVCSASKYGDYFNGGEGSLMYLDDFELIYE